MVNSNTLLVSGAVVVKKNDTGRKHWLLVKQNKDDDWEIPKTVVRKGESSVRASIRLTGEQAGMNAKILEESGRSGGTTTLNGKTIPRRLIYYLMLYKSASEILAFLEHGWFEYSVASKKLKSKSEREILKASKDIYEEWLKERERKRKNRLR